MTPRKPRGMQEWVTLLGFIVVVGGMVYNTGGTTAQIKQNTNDIAALRVQVASKAEKTDVAALQANMDSKADALNSINVRTARIEAKLDFISPPKEVLQ